MNGPAHHPAASPAPADEVERLLAAYDYDLPADLIAQEPLAERDACRLLVRERAAGRTSHRLFRNLPEILPRHGLLVLNDSRVVPARIPVRRAGGGKGEVFFLRALAGGDLLCLGRPTARLRTGSLLAAERDPGIVLRVTGKEEGGLLRARPEPDMIWQDLLERAGTIPLPPYIRRDGPPGPGDREAYQCVYAGPPGSVAAPTAGLHFTPALLRRLEEAGLPAVRVTLHVGLGTFLPLRGEELLSGELHEEEVDVPAETAARVAEAKAAGRPVIAVGTTSVRALESAAGAILAGRAWRGATRLFIRPPYRPRVADGLVTNFHLPRTSLLMLVAALCGREDLLALYALAVRERYRFYSYGDAMAVL